MAKFLLLLAVIAGVVLLLKNYQRSLSRQQKEEEGAETPRSSLEDMVRCAHCGVHLPKSESFLSQGAFYCTDEHRKLGPASKRRRGD